MSACSSFWKKDKGPLICPKQAGTHCPLIVTNETLLCMYHDCAVQLFVCGGRLYFQCVETLLYKFLLFKCIDDEWTYSYFSMRAGFFTADEAKQGSLTSADVVICLYQEVLWKTTREEHQPVTKLTYFYKHSLSLLRNSSTTSSGVAL